MDSGFLEKQYQSLVDEQVIQSNTEQVRVLKQLQKLLNYFFELNDVNSLFSFTPLSSSVFSAKKIERKSIYIFGCVGSGKSMLMDLFFDACPIKSKRRVHFHVFIQEVHESIYRWKQKHEGDPLPFLAKKIKKTSALLCFDEFHVTDIADAMLLSRLFSGLFEQGITIVLTSNQHPDNLYQHGLQRELFLPFIVLVKEESEILKLDVEKDYRAVCSKSKKTVFHVKLKGGENNFLQKKFDALTNRSTVQPVSLFVKGRQVIFLKAYDDILLTSFDELCNRLLGAADYLVVAEQFKIILIADIPRLSSEIRDQGRRFVILIDILYEKKVKIMCTLDVPVNKLTLKDKDFDFNRTQSRLFEMQSEKYFYGN